MFFSLLDIFSFLCNEQNKYVGKDYASVESVPGPRLRESGGGHVGRGGGREETERWLGGKEEGAREETSDGSIDESGWSASTMAGRAVNRPEDEEDEEEEVERTDEEEERTEEEEEKCEGEDPDGPQTTPLELGVGPPAV